MPTPPEPFACLPTGKEDPKEAERWCSLQVAQVFACEVWTWPSNMAWTRPLASSRQYVPSSAPYPSRARLNGPCGLPKPQGDGVGASEVSSGTPCGASLQPASHGRGPPPLVTPACQAWLIDCQFLSCSQLLPNKPRTCSGQLVPQKRSLTAGVQKHCLYILVIFFECGVALKLVSQVCGKSVQAPATQPEALRQWHIDDIY